RETRRGRSGRWHGGGWNVTRRVPLRVGIRDVLSLERGPYAPCLVYLAVSRPLSARGQRCGVPRDYQRQPRCRTRRELDGMALGSSIRRAVPDPIRGISARLWCVVRAG